MNHKNQISIKDYERYEIPIPIKILLRGEKQKYLYSELEKLHPCFSQEWFVLPKTRIFRKGLKSDVFVVNKMKLPYGKFGLGKKVFFEGLKVSRRILSKKEKYFFSLFILFLILFFGLWVGKSFLKDRNQQEQNLQLGTAVENNEKIVVTEENLQLVNEFLNGLEKTEGGVSWIKWNTDGYKEYFLATTFGVLPEDLILQNKDSFIGGEIVSVGYENGIPEVSVKISEKKNENNVAKNSVIAIPRNFNKAQFYKRLRNCLDAYEVSLNQESVNPFSISFSSKNCKEIQGKNFIQELNDLAKDFDCGILNFEIKQEQNNENANGFSGNLRISFDHYYINGLNLEPVAWRMNLLVTRNRNIKEKSTKNLILKNERLLEEKENTRGVKIAEISHAGGKSTIFYKTKEGKILWEK